MNAILSFVLSGILDLFLLAILGYVLLDELILLRRRRHQKLLYRISHDRFWGRVLITIIIIAAFFMAKNIFAGAYIGYVTNALVTIIILKFYIPSKKHEIAKSIGQSMKYLFENPTEDSTKNNGEKNSKKGLLFGLAAGLFIPGGWMTTALGGLGGMMTQKAVQKHKEDERERELALIMEEIQSMSHHEITDMIDSIIGRVFIVLEVLGFFFGMVFDLALG